MRLSNEELIAIEYAVHMGTNSFENKTVSKLIKHILDIDRERKTLLRQIEEEAETQKLVVLPLDVADAIVFLQGAEISDYGIISLSTQTSLLGRDYSKLIIDALNVVRKFSCLNVGPDATGESGGDILIKALANGHAVETVESRIEEGVRNIYASVTLCVPELERQDVFAREVTDFVAKIISKDQAATQQ